jgi:hypothetical protein
LPIQIIEPPFAEVVLKLFIGEEGFFLRISYFTTIGVHPRGCHQQVLPAPPSAAGAFDKVAAPPAGLWNAADAIGWFASRGYTQPWNAKDAQMFRYTRTGADFSPRAGSKSAVKLSPYRRGQNQAETLA